MVFEKEVGEWAGTVPSGKKKETACVGKPTTSGMGKRTGGDAWADGATWKQTSWDDEAWKEQNWKSDEWRPNKWEQTKVCDYKLADDRSWRGDEWWETEWASETTERKQNRADLEDKRTTEAESTLSDADTARKNV